MEFRDLNISESILERLDEKGFKEPTQIQEKAIPIVLDTELDVVGQAQTGTGKTLAFGLPILQKIQEKIQEEGRKNKKAVKAIILTPTRELALQVHDEIDSVNNGNRLRLCTVYGGSSIEKQINKLRNGVDIVIGTPGRVIDHLGRRTLKLNDIDFLVLDEADEMLNLGFIDDVEEIMSKCKPDCRKLLFSATLPKSIMELVELHMGEYETIRVKSKALTTELTEQIYYEVKEHDKFELLRRIIDKEPGFYGLVFCKTKADVDQLMRRLNDENYSSEALHGDMNQKQRELALSRFKSHKIDIMIATDVAARGIDINELTHVINYDIPQNPEAYVHRIGRTGRAGNKGTAITFVEPREFRRFKYIMKISKSDAKKEKIPDVTEIVELTKNNIIEKLKQIIQAENEGNSEDADNLENYEFENLEIVDELVELADSKIIIDKLISQLFKEELNRKSYGRIGDYGTRRGNDRNDRNDRDRRDGRRNDRNDRDRRDSRRSNDGGSRLFVALGSIDNMDTRRLLRKVTEKSDVSKEHITEVNVYRNFSFISADEGTAKRIVDAFRSERRNGKPLIEYAKR
jgi:ATP-dependent RNA helicase DeaD